MRLKFRASCQPLISTFDDSATLTTEFHSPASTAAIFNQLRLCRFDIGGAGDPDVTPTLWDLQ